MFITPSNILVVFVSSNKLSCSASKLVLSKHHLIKTKSPTCSLLFSFFSLPVWATMYSRDARLADFIFRETLI